MAFVDEVMIRAAAGSGGNGVVRWLRNKMTARGGPSGGDGGRGGDVVLVGVRDLAALSRYRYEKEFSAEQGGAGEGDLRHGKNGADCTLPVPVGTTIRVLVPGKDDVEHEILEEGERFTVFTGGRGGLGNARFKSATHQNPFEHTDGKPGGAGDIFLSLKLIADVGLVGLPNAGKSSLLNALTRAKSKVGNYAFTTIEPALGDFYGHILADIPGLIEGASAGKGLGTRFLKHIERTGTLIHLVSAEREDPIAAYQEVRSEIAGFGRALADKNELVVLSKCDLVSVGEARRRAEALARETGKEVIKLSLEDPESLKQFSDVLAEQLSA